VWGVATPGGRDHERRARATFAAITASRLFSERRKLYGKRRFVFWRSYEALWPFADAWSACCALASLPDQEDVRDFLPSLFGGLAAYHQDLATAVTGSGPVGFQCVVVPPLGQGGDVYYDDNAWLALALVRHHRLHQDDTSISLAKRLFDFVVSGWSTDASWSHPGGIRWKVPTSNVSRNACSNGSVVELGVLLHRLTGNTAALDWSVRIYDWVRSALLGSDELYADQIAPDGTLNPTVWTYNQGTMIGAGVLLAQTTGHDHYLTQAEATAAASLERFDAAALVNTNCSAFNAVFFRNLFLLGRVAPCPEYRTLAAAYADEMWNQHRDHHTELFRGGTSLLNDSAPMIEIYALLAGADPQP
jgi:Glycosyl hydrolase family 76